MIVDFGRATMGPITSEQISIDPTEVLEETLEHTWRTLCAYYDAGGELPEMRALLDGADVTIPRQAAEIALANMLVDLVESISRFSPWYTKPARAFGIQIVRDAVTKRVRFVLAPEALQQWRGTRSGLHLHRRQGPDVRGG